MKPNRIITAFIFFSIIINSATAQSRLGLRDENMRIRHGAINGELTARETGRLKIEESRLRMEALRFRANDGHISPREFAKLRRDNRRLDRNIFRQKHDRQRRF